MVDLLNMFGKVSKVIPAMSVCALAPVTPSRPLRRQDKVYLARFIHKGNSKTLDLCGSPFMPYKNSNFALVQLWLSHMRFNLKL